MEGDRIPPAARFERSGDEPIPADARREIVRERGQEGAGSKDQEMQADEAWYGSYYYGGYPGYGYGYNTYSYPYSYGSSYYRPYRYYSYYNSYPGHYYW